MRLAFGMMVGAALLLGACSKPVDDPQNVPKLGHWRKTNTLTSVEVNGRAYLGDRMPTDIRRLIATKARGDEDECSEPKIRNTQELQDLLPEKLAKNCTAESDMIAPGIHTINGKCDAPDDSGQMTGMSFYGTSTVTPDKIDAKFSIVVTGESRPGKAERVRVAMRQEHVRLGDCPA